MFSNKKKMRFFFEKLTQNTHAIKEYKTQTQKKQKKTNSAQLQRQETIEYLLSGLSTLPSGYSSNNLMCVSSFFFCFF